MKFYSCFLFDEKTLFILIFYISVFDSSALSPGYEVIERFGLVLSSTHFELLLRTNLVLVKYSIESGFKYSGKYLST